MTLQFWQGWPRNNRIIFLVLLTLFVVAIANMWVAYFIEPSPAIHLQNIAEAQTQEIIVDHFSKGPFDFTIRGNNYVILQRDLGSMLSTSDTVAYAYLVAMAVFVIGMLTVISTLGRFYYLVGMGVFILFATSLSPEVMGVFGAYGKTFTIFIMALYGFASFWLFYFAVNTSFAKRILMFTAITALLWGCIYFFSATEKPFLFIATYSAEAGLIACALFIVTVAHEIVAAFLTAVTQSPRQRKSLNHFLIITMIYVVNLVLAYCVRFGFIRWDLITVDLYLLLTISAVLGIWGIRQRRKVFEGIIDADPYAVFAFLLVGMFAFATIGMFMYNANDTALAAIRDVIIFTHIGFGVIFLTYVLSNFGSMLSQNMQVYKVVYSPTTMPFFTFRFAGLIATLALVFYNAWQVPVHNAMSGYFNGIADLYTKVGNARIARVYYDQSRTYGFHGHHSNYALANAEGSLFNSTEERIFYGDASGVRPTQMSYLNWAQTYQSAGDNLSAIATLTEGTKKVKDHESIANTLGLLYAKAGLPDSASKYLTGKRAVSNITGLAALAMIPVTDTTRHDGDPIMKANLLALDNRLGRKTSIQFALPSDTVLTLAEAASISNYLINTRDDEDTTFVRKVIALARKPSNDGFREALLFASALSLYNSGETREAFTTLEEVTVGSEHQGRYNNVLTMWALENDEPQRALGYAEYAMSQNYAPANLGYAVALTESLRLQQALPVWDSLRSGTDSIISVLATRMHKALSGRSDSFDDEELYVYSRYMTSLADSSKIPLLISGFSNDNLKAKALLDLADRSYAVDNPSTTLNTLQRIVGLQLTDARVGERMQILELLALVQTGSKQTVLDALKQNPVDFKGKNKKYRVYLDALAAEASGDSTKATEYYQWLGTANPFFEDGQIAAANYFRNKGHVSYNMLAEALLYHPSSIKIRKAYAIESARVGFDDYAERATEELRDKISTKDYNDLKQQIALIIRSREE